MRFQIAQLHAANVKLCPVTIVPGLSRNHADFFRRLDFAHAPQRFGQDIPLQRKLCLVIGVLVVATSAAPEVGALRNHTLRGRSTQFKKLRSQQTRFLYHRFHSGAFPGQHERHQHHAAVQPSQALATVNQFLDRDFEVGLRMRHRLR